MRQMTAVCILALGAVLCGGTLAAAQGDGRWIVHLQGPPDVARAAVAHAVQRSGGRVLHAFDLIPAVAVEVPLPALQGILRNPNLRRVVSLVEPDVVVALPRPVGPEAKPAKPGKPPKEPQQPPQVLPWGVDRIDAELAWDAANDGAGIKVCVIDTGIQKDHPDLVENVKGGRNFVARRRTVNPDAWDDDNGHGTHVAGIIAASHNDIGVVGVAPQAWLYAAKVLNKQGLGYLSDVVAAIQWAVNNDMDVVNMSLGASAGSTALESACDAAAEAGVVLVAAAGNEGDGDPDTNEVSYPAAYASVIAVSATDANDAVPGWSSSGPQVELAAPGVSILSTWKGGTYKTISGTSMAAPHVAGTVALVLAAQPAEADTNEDGVISVAELRAWLAATADDLGAAGWDVVSGHGLVDAEEATAGEETHP